MIKAVIFDLWGTLAYKKKSFIEDLIKLFGMPPNETSLHALERALMMRKFESPKDAYKNIMRTTKAKVNEQTERKFLLLIREQDKLSLMGFFPDVRKSLRLLKKSYRLGMISNTSQYGTSFIERQGIASLLDADIRSYLVGVIKPHKKIFVLCVKKLNCLPSETVMVGDTYESDVRPSLRLGMKAVMIKRKEDRRFYETKHQSYKYTITSLTQLPEILRKW